MLVLDEASLQTRVTEIKQRKEGRTDLLSRASRAIGEVWTKQVKPRLEEVAPRITVALEANHNELKQRKQLRNEAAIAEAKARKLPSGFANAMLEMKYRDVRDLVNELNVMIERQAARIDDPDSKIANIDLTALEAQRDKIAAMRERAKELRNDAKTKRKQAKDSGRFVTNFFKAYNMTAPAQAQVA